MNEALQRRLIIFAVCVGIPVIFLLLPPTQPVMFATMAVFAHALLWLFDCAFGAEAFGIPAVLMWALIGALIGACLGFWSIAPAVGKRRMRRVAGAIPLTVIACLLVGDVMFSIATSPKLPPLRPAQFGPDPNAAPPVAQNTPGTADPNAEKTPSLYSVPKEEELSTTPEGGGGSPADKTVDLPPAGPGARANPPPTTMNPLDNLRRRH